ncbi:MAG: Asp-tRNA(Asn)/Glu-tRNA(Gln) amidotransferase subunit GatC [Actinobacteria bacterium]|nr:Asp-tRNA(Asn)/Glu-tRNA(Gln) amidotransferase subunit GatC [Actinomycetota bacterium]MBU1944097.1 Asp-tRNA(Asn)/Glu-tRNA(Gln) amidotransferase subunit GatC [Actinomycetota bacterium]MBU2687018.1 Asp-tRNA(Asn)/Glu-tRNA(Gln) amidotransferase subunit GatC [Actinomycetota bacterium]
MAVSIEDVEHVAKLARLHLTGEEKETIRRQLSDVLEHARVISEVDTSGVPPTSHALPLVNVYREDEARPSLDPDEVVSNAAWAVEHSFKVPRIL